MRVKRAGSREPNAERPARRSRVGSSLNLRRRQLDDVVGTGLLVLLGAALSPVLAFTTYVVSLVSAPCGAPFAHIPLCDFRLMDSSLAFGKYAQIVVFVVMLAVLAVLFDLRIPGRWAAAAGVTLMVVLTVAAAVAFAIGSQVDQNPLD